MGNAAPALVHGVLNCLLSLKDVSRPASEQKRSSSKDDDDEVDIFDDIGEDEDCKGGGGSIKEHAQKATDAILGLGYLGGVLVAAHT